MPKHTINWVNDHTEICDRLNERVAADARLPQTASPTTLTVSPSSGSCWVKPVNRSLGIGCRSTHSIM